MSLVCERGCDGEVLLLLLLLLLDLHCHLYKVGTIQLPVCLGPVSLLVQTIRATQGVQELLRALGLLIGFLYVDGLEGHPNLVPSTPIP